MSKSLRLLIMLTIVLSFSKESFSKKEKFGKVSPELFDVTVCPIDSNAHAYYLFDRGNTYFQFNKSFNTMHERHLRIKILDQSAVDNATFEIPLYSNGSLDERISGIKAITHNLENGKVVQYKLSKKDILRDHVSKNRILVKFALPNVKAGSVIELTYKISSEFLFNLPDWYFQKTIPVLKSEYRVDIPEYYVYKQFQKGYLKINTKKSSATNSINISQQVLSYSTEIFEYLVEDIPAFPVGEHLTTVENYISKVDFELERYEIPGVVSESYNHTWDDINKLYLEHSNFGEKLKSTGYLKECAKLIDSKGGSAFEKMQLALYEVVGKTKWNNINSCFASQSLKKTFETGVGNSADINLNLLALLRKLELEAYPVALSTRSHGMIHVSSPSASRFNYVVALCLIDGKEYLLDATNKNSEIGIIPGKCMNYQGRLVDEQKSRWVELMGEQKYKINSIYMLKMEADGTLVGQTADSYLGNASYYFRNRIDKYETHEKYIEKVEENNEGLEITNPVFENIDSIGANVRVKYEMKYKDHVEQMGDLAFLTPLIFEAYEVNPLKLEKREYPVEYTYPEEEKVVVILKIPEGYQVESIPESLSMAALNNSCIFKYIVKEAGGQIVINNQICINRTIFPYNEYDDLKTFYEGIVKKQAEKIVLKKI